jgi:hypothetical protein
LWEINPKFLNYDSGCVTTAIGRRRKREEHCSVLDISSVLVYCLGIVLAIYIKEFFVGFSPP